MKTKSLQVLLIILGFGLLLSCTSNTSNRGLQNPNSDNPDVKLIPVAKGYANTSVNTTIFRRNSVFTHEETQYIAFYDPDGNVTLGKRKLESTEWELHTTQYQGNVRDAHNSISIAVDGAGYLHISWDHHNHPLRYARSLEPEGLELGEREQPNSLAAEHTVTYPEFYRMPNGNLLFMYRHGRSGDGFQVLHHYDLNSGSWNLLHEQLIDGQGEVNPYWQATIDDAGTLHLSWNWRRHGGVETNHDLAYARSRDGGITWEKTNGQQYELPITPETAEYALRIPENSVMMNQTSMAADSQGRPYIVNYWRPEGSDIPQYHLVYHDGEEWQVIQVGQLEQVFDLQGGGTMAPPISRPQIAVDTSGEHDRVYVIFRAEERGRKVSVAVSDNIEKGEWQVHDLTDMNVGAWEPSFDTSLWQREKKLHLFVQRVGQLDHEQADDDIEPQMVYLLEWDPD